VKNVLIKSTLIAITITFISFKKAHAAYIDPNTGGMVFQVLAVLFGVISGMILLFSSRIKAAYYRVRRSLRNEEQGEEEAEEV
jgi:uncharacterized YccA/Bax inhibitor family protein